MVQPIPEPKFCVKCGTALTDRVPKGDHRTRKVCPACEFVHYVSPKIAAGTIVEMDNRIVLIQRDVDPRKGFWSFPCGFVEADETLEAGAIRETKEEAGVDVELLGHLGTYSYAQSWHGGTVVVVAYHARVIGGTPKAGDDAIDLKLVRRDQIPWDDLAFLSTHAAIKAWLERR